MENITRKEDPSSNLDLEGWEEVNLGLCFDFKNGLNKEKKYFGQGTPIVNYMDVYKNRGLRRSDILGKVLLSKEEIKNYEVLKGDVLFTRTSETVEEIGISSVILENVVDTVFSGFVLRARPKNEKLDLHFKKYCFSTSEVRKEITSKSSYTTRALTNGRLLSNVILKIPRTKAEQTAIAQVLSDTDELISSLEKLIEKKKLIKQGTMQQLLTGKKRLPGFSGEWEVKKLGDVAEIRDGTHQTPVYVDDGIQFYSVENITENNFTNTKFISLEEHKRLTKTYKIEKGDILMTRIGSIGDCKLINWDVEASFYVSLALLKIKKGYSNKFIAHLIKSYDFQKEIELRSLQWAVPKKINLGAISAIDIKIPTDVTEQDAIAEVLNNIDSDIESLEQKLNKYKLIKQGMMQNLLTGKIRLV
ncbi:MAG: restriction endonuclease subunit S [Ignavibacteria bacterium]|nr:restriction endonuclease subunit S [Ignavibacteria bacterium]